MSSNSEDPIKGALRALEDRMRAEAQASEAEGDRHAAETAHAVAEEARRVRVGGRLIRTYLSVGTVVYLVRAVVDPDGSTRMQSVRRLGAEEDEDLRTWAQAERTRLSEAVREWDRTAERRESDPIEVCCDSRTASTLVMLRGAQVLETLCLPATAEAVAAWLERAAPREAAGDAR